MVGGILIADVHEQFSRLWHGVPKDVLLLDREGHGTTYGLCHGKQLFCIEQVTVFVGEIRPPEIGKAVGAIKSM